MKYTLTLYDDGKVRSKEYFDGLEMYNILCLGANALYHGDDEYEITNEHGHIVAYAYTEDNPKALQANSERAQSRKEAQADRMADIARDIQREELASRQAQRGSR